VKNRILLISVAFILSLALGAPRVWAGDIKSNAAKSEIKKSSPEAKVASVKPAKKSKKSGSKKSKKAPAVASTWSPNKFPIGRRGYCTWYADGRFFEYYGEKLEFSLRNRTNAKTWFERVANLEKSMTPRPGDIAVFKASTKKRRDPTGHVAFVEAVDGDRIIVSQGNFDYPGHKAMAIRYIDGKKVTVDVMVPGSKTGRYRVEGASHEFILAGFLHKPDTGGKIFEELAPPLENSEVAEQQLTGPEQLPAVNIAD
jgi:surface antigen